ncbi:MAG: hypothetical protein H6977_20910 [Gammaproteobacteria bacterium]|nr:hypothetical protein [Gammaproteobacteria bacterium]MCP5202465.1 hypothetical protein [Gammaproteobacteria bacterium]
MLMLCSAATAATPWRYRAAGSDAPARAEVVNEAGDRLSIWREGERVRAEFVAATLAELGPTACPTFQVDQRQPLYYFPLGEGCSLSAHGARFELLDIPGRRFPSAVLYGLMNGSRVAFRFVTRDGAYHESRFALTQSKRALLRALGRDLDVQPPDD